MKKAFLLFPIVFFLQTITFPQQNPIRIVCNAPYMQSDCDVDGDYIVWKDGRDLKHTFICIEFLIAQHKKLHLLILPKIHQKFPAIGWSGVIIEMAIGTFSIIE